MADLSTDSQAMLDAANEMLDSGEYEQAWMLLTRMDQEDPENPEILILMGDASMQMGDPNQALELFDRCVDLDPEWSDAWSARAGALLELALLDEASDNLRKAISLDRNNSEALYLRAVVLELQGRFREADAAYRRAHRAAPDRNPIPVRMTRKDFLQTVQEALWQLPAQFRDRMDAAGVQIRVLDVPDPQTMLESGLSPQVLGAFQGASVLEESVTNPQPTLPPVIHLYQRNIERVCTSRDQVRMEIQVTLFHEVGHYFGLEEEDLARLNLD
ncbi:metallopeptidase family protein [Myxococcota bacterium]|nr:metallopeptidase family protein [Myxococcota bacterium]